MLRRPRFSVGAGSGAGAAATGGAGSGAGTGSGGGAGWATAITTRLKIPKRIVTILEGESLVNDATALVAYRIAVAAGTIASRTRSTRSQISGTSRISAA